MAKVGAVVAGSIRKFVGEEEPFKLYLQESPTTSQLAQEFECVLPQTDYSRQHNRVSSFAEWPSDSPEFTDDFAEAGFYYTGNGDTVRCFECGLQLMNWSSEADPWEEHKNHNPRCLFVKKNYGSTTPIYSGSLGTISEGPEERYINNKQLGSGFVTAAAEVAKAVGRVRGTDQRATGFRIAKRLIMTCEHVGRSVDENYFIEFNYSEPVNPNSPGGTSWRKPDIFRLQPEVFYYGNDKLDYAVIAIQELRGKEKSLENVEIIRFFNATWSTKEVTGHPRHINTMGHPEGKPLQVSVRLNVAVEDNKENLEVGNPLRPATEEIILHTADTNAGSSGSPLFDDQWRLIGIHQGIATERIPSQDGNQNLLPNYGTLIKFILDDMFSDTAEPKNFKKELQRANNRFDLGMPFGTYKTRK